MIAQVLNWIAEFFTRITSATFGYLAKLFGYLFQKLFDLLKLLFNPIFIVVAILFYFLYKLAELAISILSVFLAIGKLFFAFVTGIFLTLGGFTFSGTPRSDGSWSNVFANVVTGLDTYQFDIVAYILLFLIWFSTGFAAIRILSSMRGGGE